MRIFGLNQPRIRATWVIVLALVSLACGLPGCGERARGPRPSRPAGTDVDPSDLTGMWKLAVIQIPVEQDAALIKITHEKEKFGVELVEDPKQSSGRKIKSFDITKAGQVKFEFEIPNGPLSIFEGRLDGETVWGTMLVPQFQLTCAKLERTELTKLDPEQQPGQIPALPGLMAAETSNDKYVALDEFIKKPESYRSPLLIEAYGAQARYLKFEKLNTEQIRKFIAEYRQAVEVWGPRMGARVDLEVGKALANQEIESALAKELLKQAEQKITDEYPLEWKIQLAESYTALNEPEHTLALLKPMLEAYPTNPFVRLAYGRAKELTKDIDAALEEYAGAAVLPQFDRVLTTQLRHNPALVLPGEAVAKLWKAKHGSTKGLDEFLEKAYEEQMKRYVPKRKQIERGPKDRVVLMEIFTSSTCDPCVAIDIASEALGKGFSPKELVLIKYHTHNPLPDPLANESNMSRYDFYHAQGTPTVLIDGKYFRGGGGSFMDAGRMVTLLTAVCEEEMKEAAPVEIKLSAKQAGDDIEIQASVSGIKTTDNDPRLVLVLVENQISYHALNGIRVHDNVARAFPAGPLGTKLKPGPEVEHTFKVSLSNVKKEQAEHLKKFEDLMGREFPSKPINLKNLSVIAFVQNQLTLSFMQAKQVDIQE